jgi:hypothetical protein
MTGQAVRLRSSGRLYAERRGLPQDSVHRGDRIPSLGGELAVLPAGPLLVP